MQTLLCATGNSDKFGIGQRIFSRFGIELKQVVVDADEIQGEDPELIIRDKVRKAYELLGKPVVVTDDSWSIPALNGFPGPYMKSINQWFTPEDFIRLTKGLPSRQIILNQAVAYQDELETIVFKSDLPGEILTKPRGQYGPPIMKVVALDGEDGLTISERYDAGAATGDKNIGVHGNGAWLELAKWYKQKLDA